MVTRTYKDEDDRIVVDAPKSGEDGSDSFVTITRLMRHANGRWHTEESVAIGFEAWRRIIRDGVSD